MNQNICPYCQNSDKQVWNGKNPSGSQKFKCMECKRVHTPNPNSKAYPEEIRSQAKKLAIAGMSGRRIGQIMGFSKANVYNWCKAEVSKACTSVKKTNDIVDKSNHP